VIKIPPITSNVTVESREIEISTVAARKQQSWLLYKERQSSCFTRTTEQNVEGDNTALLKMP
jgi:hypothetical protein